MSAAAEMRNPKDFPKSLVFSRAITTACYLTFGLVVYAYCVQSAASPALGTAGPLIKKIAYGLALPGLFISCTLFLHISAKHLFVRILKNTAHWHNRTRTHFSVW
jgi:amino acid transporter